MIWASKLEHFRGTDLGAEQLFGEVTRDELQRFLASDYKHGVLIYGEDGSIYAVWSESQVSPYSVSRLPLELHHVQLRDGVGGAIDLVQRASARRAGA